MSIVILCLMAALLYQGIAFLEQKRFPEGCSCAGMINHV